MVTKRREMKQRNGDLRTMETRAHRYCHHQHVIYDDNVTTNAPAAATAPLCSAVGVRVLRHASSICYRDGEATAR